MDRRVMDRWGSFHASFIWERRAAVLTSHLINLLKGEKALLGLDVGCGNGKISSNIQESCPQIKIEGLEIIVREKTAIQTSQYDGQKIPYADKSRDFIMLIDVLHHTDHCDILLKESIRCAREFILIKDHICDNIWDEKRLRFMDYFGNIADGVPLPYNYFSKAQWNKKFHEHGLIAEKEFFHLGLYPFIFSWIFDGNLHFIAKLRIKRGA